MKPKTQTASLRAAAAFSAVTVDHEAGIIFNAAVMTTGPAKGWGFILDAASLETFITAFAAKGGRCKVRFRHPSDPNAEDLGTDVATLTNVRIEGEQVRGDVQLADHADAMPVIGNVRKYLLSKAANDPGSFGLSAVIAFDPEEVNTPNGKAVAARIRDVVAVDFVGDPAANPNGLLSAAKDKMTMKNYDPTKHGAKLRAQFGFSDKADDAMLEAVFNALTDEAKAKFDEDEEPKAPAPAPMSSKPATDTAALESKRIEGITRVASLYTRLGVDNAVVTGAIAAGISVDDATKAFQAALANVQVKPAVKTPESVSVGDDLARKAQLAAIPEAVMLRAGCRTSGTSHELAGKWASLSLVDMFRAFIRSRGIADADMMSRAQLAGLIIGKDRTRGITAQLAQATADFDNILIDAANKTLRTGYAEAPKSWSLWAKRSTNPDFKAGNRVLLSEVGTPILRDEGAEVTYNTLTDSRETVTLREYVTAVKLTRQAVINDDLGAFNVIQSRMGLAFARLEDNLAYDVLTTNAALASTTGALFNSTAVTTAGGHANLATGTGIAGSPTVATLQATSRLMRVQRGLKGDAYLDLQPKALIVPVALEVTAAQLVGSNVDPARNNATPNPYFNRLTVVSHPRLDANSTSRWYLAADPNAVDTVEVCFLADEPAPVIKTETDFDTDDVKFAGRHTVTAKAIDYRGLVRNGS